MNEKPVAFVTGASRGIGRGIALELARRGFDIVGNATSYDPGNREKGLAEVEAAVTALGAAFEPAPGDNADLAAHAGMADRALKRFGRVDAVVLNAGIAPPERLDVLETTPENFDRVFAVNTRGTFFLAQRFARILRDAARKDPGTFRSLQFVTSISAYISSVNRAEYCMSKAAVSHGARVFAHRLAGEGVHVFDVRPGIIATDMTSKVTEKYDPLIRDGLVPERRWGFPEDVGRAVATLASGDLTFCTGQVIEVGGGIHIRQL